MNQKEIDFFRPKHRRILAILLCLFWTAVEWLTGAYFWAVIASALSAYAYWSFFYTFDEKANTDKS
ncbi:hypothetical protein DN062_03095 [Nitrincola tibetensis]|uniref:DUF3329 domain-containing protein n=1 Tax=Nitrincola tibetensis TaxID=2219697 RepID=A0A364NQU9_9GAMM|nr:hypothetical protein [Nitrincola tibetensis]RAU19267.1 hypothetical protein DN062_03095 [Nitrincola tibetensis]